MACQSYHWKPAPLEGDCANDGHGGLHHKNAASSGTCNGAVEIELRDQGEPFDPPKEPISPPDETCAGGRGIFMMQAIMDEVEYTRQGTTNSVRMKKYLPGKNG